MSMRFFGSPANDEGGEESDEPPRCVDEVSLLAEVAEEPSHPTEPWRLGQSTEIQHATLGLHGHLNLLGQILSGFLRTHYINFLYTYIYIFYFKVRIQFKSIALPFHLSF